MSHKLILWILGLLIIILALSGRILRVEGAQLPSAAHTSVASTLQVIFTQQSTPTALQPLIAITPSATPQSLPLDTVTPTYSVPVLTVREATNCRTGPGKPYEIIVTYQVNQTLKIVGRNESGDFWLVKSAESPTGTCWLWGEFVDVAGSYWTVSSVTPPPTAILPPLAPKAPSLHDFDYDCDGFNNTLSFYVIWNDKADNESGYRIIRDGLQAAELPAGSTTYAETITMPASKSAQYYVEVYNAAGLSQTKVMQLICDY
ncbi:MAG TPA: SH3 domain-containing protein [Anaerolineales bacterium]|nr:SH3 domain-containing protein [Anaerolineales bacterium]